MTEQLKRFATFLREHGAHVATEAIINIGLPLLIYDLLNDRWGDVHALIASSAPPILWSVIEFARHRRVDAVALLALGGIALSLLAFIGGGSVRFLQLRETLVTAIIGLVFLGSVVIGRPLIYELARAGKARTSAAEAAEFEKLRVHAGFRQTMVLMTLVWAFGLIASVCVSIALLYSLSIREYLVVQPVISYATLGGLGLWTFWYGRRAQRRGEARRANEEATVAAEAPNSSV
jgi:hypothetical protein